MKRPYSGMINEISVYELFVVIEENVHDKLFRDKAEFKISCTE